MEMDIRNIAKLARLNLQPEKVQQFEKEIENILAMVANLPDIDVSGAIIDTENTMQARPDEPAQYFTREEMLQNAPSVTAGYVKLPKLVDE
ncbi:Asp-tRNA(Asn)/Glu-tRNA(Gln) amidotransferase subunit GatC [Ruminococcaceae bacterium OttesenSCG-928-N02]|nr:Asp-tRNA(Asn)/Glu-tRNA(Gln) amidotransferase subunit GatC [Ruminococcaceae bacterium OttesenSCG-928-N02]